MSDYYYTIHTGEVLKIVFKKGLISSKSITLVYNGMVNKETFAVSTFTPAVSDAGLFSPLIFFNKNLENISIGRYQFSVIEVADLHLTVRPTQFLEHDVDL